jgi:hypothetical protein
MFKFAAICCWFRTLKVLQFIYCCKVDIRSWCAGLIRIDMIFGFLFLPLNVNVSWFMFDGQYPRGIVTTGVHIQVCRTWSLIEYVGKGFSSIWPQN